MRIRHLALPAALLALGASTLTAQAAQPAQPAQPAQTPKPAQAAPATPPTPAALRAAPSGRGIAEVTLSYPREMAAAGAQPVTIRLDYGQPHLRGRTLHTDSLVPYDKAWRTGANGSTTFTTGVDLVVGGQPLAKGTYVIWTLPSRTAWKLYFVKSDTPGAMQSAMRFDSTNVVAQVSLRQQTLSAPLESLTMWLIPARDASPARGELRMAWGTTMLSTDWAVR